MAEHSDPGRYDFWGTPDNSTPFLPAGFWQKVSGGDLPMPVWLRLHRDPEGRFVITGLLIGEDYVPDGTGPQPQEITSQTLRQIKLRDIMSDLLRDYDPDSPPDWTSFVGVLDILTKLNAGAGYVARGRPPRGPDDETLKAFAQTYRTEWTRQPQRAMTAAAEAHDISRATAHRWAERCRELGYLRSRP